MNIHTGDLDFINPENIHMQRKSKEISAGSRALRKFTAETQRYMNVFFMVGWFGKFRMPMSGDHGLQRLPSCVIEPGKNRHKAQPEAITSALEDIVNKEHPAPRRRKPGRPRKRRQTKDGFRRPSSAVVYSMVQVCALFGDLAALMTTAAPAFAAVTARPLP